MFTLTIFTIFYTHNYAQNSFITEIPKTQAHLDGLESRLKTLNSGALSKYANVISIGKIKYFAPNGELKFVLPGLADTLDVRTEMVTEGVDELNWFGDFTNKPGYMALNYHNDLITGFIQSGADYYEIIPFDTKYQFLIKRDNKLINKDCGLSALDKKSSEDVQDRTINYCNPIAHSPSENCPALISVLLVITPEAKAWIEPFYGSLDVFATLAKLQENFAFYRSDIPNKEIRVKWIEKNVTPKLSTDITVDRTKLPDLIGNDRNTAQADVAFLVPIRVIPVWEEVSWISGLIHRPHLQ